MDTAVVQHALVLSHCHHHSLFHYFKAKIIRLECCWIWAPRLYIFLRTQFIKVEITFPISVLPYLSLDVDLDGGPDVYCINSRTVVVLSYTLLIHLPDSVCVCVCVCVCLCVCLSDLVSSGMRGDSPLLFLSSRALFSAWYLDWTPGDIAGGSRNCVCVCLCVLAFIWCDLVAGGLFFFAQVCEGFDL